MSEDPTPYPGHPQQRRTRGPHKASGQALPFRKRQCSQRVLFAEDRKKKNLMSGSYFQLQVSRRLKIRHLDYNPDQTEGVI